MEWNSLGKHQTASRFLPWFVAAVSLFAWVQLILNPVAFEPVIQGVALSTVTAAVTTLVSMLLLSLRADRWARGFAWVSPMILSLAWWRAYALEVPRGASQEWILAGLVVGVQMLLFLPWALRFLEPLYRRRRAHEMEAIQTLGATPYQAWIRVEWPRLRPDVHFVFSLLWCFSLAEVSTVMLFSRGGFEPLGVWVQNRMTQFRVHEAWVGTFLLMSLSFLMIRTRAGSLRRKR